jgi:hypothetical protein
MFRDLRGFKIGFKAFDQFPFLIDQELGEIPLDLASKCVTFFSCQVLIKGCASLPFTLIFARTLKVTP